MSFPSDEAAQQFQPRIAFMTTWERVPYLETLNIIDTERVSNIHTID